MRIKPNRLRRVKIASRRLPLVLCLSLLPLTASVSSYGVPQGQSTETPAAQNLPLVLLFTPNKAGAKFSSKNDPNAAIRILVRDTLRDSGRYQVLAFQPNNPTIGRALREHTIASADMVEPISSEAMQRIAKALGARFVLSLDTTLNSEELKTQVRFEESTGTEEWRTAYTDQNIVPLISGKRKLKFDEAVALAADTVIVRLGLPSQIAKNPALSTIKPPEKPAKEKDKGKSAKTTEKAPTKAAAQNKSGTPEPNSANGQAPDKMPVATPAEKTASKNTKQTVSPEKKSSAVKPTSGTQGTASGTRITPPVPDPNAFSNFSTDGAAGRDTTPIRPDVAPPPTQTKPDEESAVTRYRQAGDLANVIASLRKAINDRPRDTLLRRQLIQAYQDRQMVDKALDETNRALQLLPEDSGLRRYYGNALLAKGDMPGALQAFREAVRLDPMDVAASVALADALMTDGQYADAQTAYDTASKADPKSPLPHRRMANALARRAIGDAQFYAASLDQLQIAHNLTATSDTETYLEDYTALVHLMEARLRDMLTELQSDFQARQQGKLTGDALNRALADLKLRGEAAADYLDKLTPASGHKVTHAHYEQGAALLLQALSLFREYIAKSDDATLAAMKGAQVDANRELTAGAKALAVKAEMPPPASNN